ncbi:hypothetical protein GcM3_220014 [Golovinomyces cichoracearum]|uniref:Uncharacterized protein n=1 Tax=Golovinomyces cichoracearum TaxID=62708 RepID=A0A420H721_9PEZI|nr:hypothetical protein GcM3_220014 [Golovinomyces cichoracearum]
MEEYRPVLPNTARHFSSSNFSNTQPLESSVCAYSVAQSLYVYTEELYRNSILLNSTDVVWRMQQCCTKQVAKMNTTMLSMPSRFSHTGNTYLEQQYTLRACNRDYRRSVSKRAPLQHLVELDGCRQLGKIAPLTTFDTKWIECIEYFVFSTIKNGYTWDLDRIITVDIENDIKRSATPTEARDCIESQILNKHNPIFAYSAQAYVKCREKRGRKATLYPMLTQSTQITGIMGGINNNATLEMGFEEKRGRKTWRNIHTEKTCLPLYVAAIRPTLKTLADLAEWQALHASECSMRVY